jgi:hypothetical protein
MNNDQLILNELKSINKRLDGLEQGQKELHEGQKRLEQATVKKTDLKSFIDTLNPAIKASEENIKLFVKAEIVSSEQRTKKEIKATKEDLQTEILASRAAAHEDMEKLGAKIWKKDREQDIRLDALEDHTGLSNPIKH